MRIRLLPYAIADGATNMASDEALLRSAADGIASLRFYGWTEATVSLGYFQSHAIHRADPSLGKLPWVRRPSGGATLVHHHELTYALALPPGPWQVSESWMLRMHRVIVVALESLGLMSKVTLVDDKPVKHGEVLCFQQFTVGDVLCAGGKIVGSAQRKWHQAILQHGSILLAQSEHTPRLPGIRELAGVALTVAQVRETVERVFIAQVGCEVETGDWTARERMETKRLIEERYGNAEWNERR